MPCGRGDYMDYKVRLTDDRRVTEHGVFNEARELWKDQIVQGPVSLL